MRFNNLEMNKFICENYANKTATIEEIRLKFKISPNDIYKILKQHNIPLKSNNTTESDVLKFCEYYESGMTLDDIKNIMGYSTTTIREHLLKNNVKIRKIYRTYQLDETIFETIDTKEKAQFLGFIYADGTLSKYNKNIAIRLRDDDEEYLRMWSETLLKTDKPLYRVKSPEFMTSPSTKVTYKMKYDTIGLDITSKKIYEDALKIGLKPNKTTQNLPMPKIDDELRIPFILEIGRAHV